jgi:DNA-binding CsgD family transcriptional regulator
VIQPGGVRNIMDPPKPTPRQQQILELASLGLSDSEIAARLNVSPRTIRFQIEKIFRMSGVRSRSAAIALRMDSTFQVQRPLDECPYPKPFPDHFAECPAYQARQVIALDERNQPVGRTWTCQHLESQLMAKTEHRWYGACVLGGIVGRQRWAEWAGPGVVRALNDMTHELAPVTGPCAQRLWELKGDQVRALERNLDPRPATRSMEAVAGRFMRDIETFLNRRRSLLEQHHLAIDEYLDVARRLIDRVLDQGSPATWDDRFDALMRFPEDVWSVSPSTSPGSAIQARR